MCLVFRHTSYIYILSRYFFWSWRLLFDCDIPHQLCSKYIYEVELHTPQPDDLWRELGIMPNITLNGEYSNCMDLCETKLEVAQITRKILSQFPIKTFILWQLLVIVWTLVYMVNLAIAERHVWYGSLAFPQYITVWLWPLTKNFLLDPCGEYQEYQSVAWSVPVTHLPRWQPPFISEYTIYTGDHECIPCHSVVGSGPYKVYHRLDWLRYG